MGGVWSFSGRTSSTMRSIGRRWREVEDEVVMEVKK
jgi:hypothetical protein